MDPELNNTFQRIKPVCARLLSSFPDRNAIDAYITVVKSLSNDELTVFADYIIFPALVILSKNSKKSDGASTLCSEAWQLFPAITSIGAKVRIQKGTFLKIFHFLAVSLETPDRQKKQYIGRLLSDFLSKCQSENVLDLLDPKVAPLLAQITFCFCEIAKSSNDYENDCLVLDLIERLSCEKDAASGILPSFLPGISASVIQMLQRDKPMPSHFKVKITQCYAALIDVCMSPPGKNEEEAQGRNYGIVCRDEKWFTEAWRALEGVIKALVSIRSDRRTAEIDLAKLLLISSVTRGHLLPENYRSIALPVVFESFASEYSDVKAEAEKLLSSIHQSIKIGKGLFLDAVRCLPRKILGNTFDLEKQRTLGILCGSLDYLIRKSAIATFLLHRCLYSLVQVCAVDLSRIDISISENTAGYPDLMLQHFHSGSPELRIFHSISGCLGDKEVFSQTFVHLLSIISRPKLGNAALFLLFAILSRSTEHLSAEDIANTVQALAQRLDELEVDEDLKDDVIDTETLSSNESTVDLCLVAKLLGILSRNVEDFDDNVHLVLGQLLKFSLSRQIAVSRSCRASIAEMSRNSGKSAADFLSSHAAAIISTVVLQLRHFDFYPLSAITFSAFVTYFPGSLTSDIAQLLSNMTSDLLPILDAAHERQSHAVLRVLKCVIGCMARDPPPSPPPRGEPDAPKPKLPLVVACASAILARAKHLIKNIRHKHLTLICIDIFRDGLITLRNWEDELLPLVHQNWAPLISIFDFAGLDPYLQRSAFYCILTMSEVAKDFVLSRFMKEFWPKLEKTMAKLASASDGCTKFYKSSPQFRLQWAVTENLEVIVRNMDLHHEKFANAFCHFIELYSKDSQPVELKIGVWNLKQFLDSLSCG